MNNNYKCANGNQEPPPQKKKSAPRPPIAEKLVWFFMILWLETSLNILIGGRYFPNGDFPSDNLPTAAILPKN